MEEPQEELSKLPLRVTGNHASRFKDIKLTSNHFSVSLKEIKQIYIFSVRYEPQIPSKNTTLRMELLKKNREAIKEVIPNPVMTGFNIYSTTEPKKDQLQIKEKEYVINIKKVKTFDLSKDQKMILTFLNNGLRGVMSRMKYVEIGRSGKYFNSDQSQRQKIDNLYMYSGFKINFLSLESGHFLRVDPAKKIVRSETVLQEIDKIYKGNANKDKMQKRQIVKVQLVNKIIMSNYGKTTYYKIKDIEFIRAQDVLLENQQNLLDYYLQKYSIKIVEQKQPLLLVESRRKQDQKPIYLIPELMLMTGIPDNFDEQRRKMISQKTIKPPAEKAKEINTAINRIKKDNHFNDMKELGIDLKGQMISVDAKLIPVPILKLGGKQSVQTGKQAFFNLFGQPIFKYSHDIPLKIIYGKNANIKEMKDTFDSTFEKLGVKMQTDVVKLEGSLNQQKILNEIEKAIEKGFKICCIVLPVNDKKFYKQIKISSLKMEMITQFVTEATLRKKGLRSIATKILLQIICKRGNILWSPKMSVEPEMDIMLVGFDQSKVGGKTLMAISASINSTNTIAFTNFVVYETEEEKKFQAMKQLLAEAITAYSKRNQVPPSDIIIFMNDCPQDQVNLFIEQFVIPAQKQAKKVMKQEVKIMLIMVNGKTSERFFIKRGDNYVNPPAGSLVFKDLVSKDYNFYIISQETTRGTAVPNHYKVVYSDSKIEEGLLQELIFSQCFGYYNWTGSIKIPAILQYAKKAALFCSEVLADQKVPQNLRNKYYFI